MNLVNLRQYEKYENKQSELSDSLCSENTTLCKDYSCTKEKLRQSPFHNSIVNVKEVLSIDYNVFFFSAVTIAMSNLQGQNSALICKSCGLNFQTNDRYKLLDPRVQRLRFSAHIGPCEKKTDEKNEIQAQKCPNCGIARSEFKDKQKKDNKVSKNIVKKIILKDISVLARKSQLKEKLT